MIKEREKFKFWNVKGGKCRKIMKERSEKCSNDLIKV